MHVSTLVENKEIIIKIKYENMDTNLEINFKSLNLSPFWLFIYKSDFRVNWCSFGF